MLRQLPGFENFNALLEVLRLLRCGFGLKDAPRLWNKLLKEELKKIGLRPLQSDPELYVWHVSEPTRRPTSGASAPAGAGRLVLIISTHVDDLKGAGEEKYRQIFLKTLEARFGALKIKQRCFECVGVMHEHDPKTFEIWTHQGHYVPQIKEIPCDLKALVSDETPADEDMTAMFMSLVGALAWLVLTMPAICVYVAYLQRHTKAPTLGHVRRGNRLLRWIRRNKTRLGVWFRKLQGPLRLMTLSDSAFKAQDYQGLVMRGCIILLVEAEVSQSGSTQSAVKKSDKSGGSPPAIGTGQNVRCQVLDWYA